VILLASAGEMHCQVINVEAGTIQTIVPVQNLI
jgi:hypothetical protein